MKNLYYILVDKGPVAISDLEEWNEFFESDGRRVDLTETPNGTVSTVFLGIDHQFGEGPSILFETLISGGDYDFVMIRYHTWDDAKKRARYNCSQINRW